jgi:acetyl esterase/lipase
MRESRNSRANAHSQQADGRSVIEIHSRQPSRRDELQQSRRDLEEQIVWLLAAGCWFLASAAPAAAQPCPSLEVGNPAGNYIIPGVKGDIRYSGNLALDAYVQQEPARPPSIVVIHGGGWSSGSRIAHVGQILEFLTISAATGFRSATASAGGEIR